jgi:hypothetical protein
MKNYFLLLVLVFIAGCTSKYTTAERISGGGENSGLKAYAIAPKEALQIAHTAIVEKFPGRKISAIEGPIWGYSTYTRVLFDTYNQQVLVKAFEGNLPTGETATGIVFEVSGSGTSGSGRLRNGVFFEHVQYLADQTNSAIALRNAREVLLIPESRTVGNVKGKSVSERLVELKRVFEQGLISQQEFDIKRKEILQEI